VSAHPGTQAVTVPAKDRDYWWTVLAVDPAAIPLARWLASRRLMTADQATLWSVAFAVPIGFAYATGTRSGLAAGALLFYLAFLFDCIDGKLARALGTTSARGQTLDEIADAARRVSASCGLAVYLWRTGDGLAFWLAVAYLALAFFFAQVSGGTRAKPQTGLGGRWSTALARRRLLPTPGTPDVGAIVFIFGPLTGQVAPALVLGDTLLAVAIVLVLSRLLRTGGGRGRPR
jgi:phosphatidylglycerophosphate synthase